MAGDINRHSERTIETRRERLGRLDWFLRHREFPSCGLPEPRAFFHYLNEREWEADVANQRRQFSPVARLGRQKGGRA